VTALLFSCRVYFEDTDAAGVVYHANHLHFIERARTEALRDLGVSHAALMEQHGLIFVVRRIKMDYLRVARLDDQLEVATTVLVVGASRMDLSQAIRRRHDQGHEQRHETIAEAEVGLACVRRDNGRPARIPPRWRHVLGALAARETE
jgi:acyl-CoA thioester hydrolase